MRTWPDDFVNKIICGNCLDVMKEMPDSCVDMCLCSPPYWGLRDYGLGPDQLGLEPTPELYIEHMTAVFHKVKRVLKKEGTLWLNIGDTYGGGSGGYYPHDGELGASKAYINRPSNKMEKCLCMIPERLAWSLIQDGWILRNKIIWYKPNGMPSSVKDRFSNKWEYVFMFSKSKKYYFDLNAVREPHKETTLIRQQYGHNSPGDGSNLTEQTIRYRMDQCANPKGKNPGDIWIIPTVPCPVKGIHFATFPEELCRKAILPGCPEEGIVLDPFCGIGTTCYVAQHLRRKFMGIDIKQEFCEKADRIRLAQGVL